MFYVRNSGERIYNSIKTSYEVNSNMIEMMKIFLSDVLLTIHKYTTVASLSSSQTTKTTARISYTKLQSGMFICNTIL